MPTYFQRPENALNRAKEFIGVGKKQRALDALYDVIKSKKHRTWQKTHEQIMDQYLNLCVALKKSHIAKEGLYQYKNICQQVNIQSLVDVVRRYIALAEDNTEAARQESHQAVVDIDDLDVPDTPESLLLKAVSGEDTQDRTDRAILTPWVKFLWESYRQCLDLLRNNSRVERLYQDIAQQAFAFCLKYGRKTEFRKLCDNLRTHLGHVHKHQHQQTAINLNNPDSQGMHLETRLVQLDSAINMELWQEAFKAVEDIYGLISLSKKSPKPALMANYYQKLSLVFWKSGNQLFHASTLHRLYVLSREQKKNISQDELQKLASRVLCATLSIPIPPARNSIDALLEMEESTMEKKRRLSTLLMLQNPPTRQALIADLVKFNIIQYVHPDLQNFYRYLELEFHPLKLHTRLIPSIEYISKSDLKCYEPSLEDIIITRVLKQVSQVYQTIEFSRFCALVPFASSFHLERVIVNTAKSLELQVRMCHKTKSLSFGTDLGLAQKEDVPEGPHIQKMPSEQIRNQLIGMASGLHAAVDILTPKDISAEKEELRSQVVGQYRTTSKKEHQRILSRRQIIEERKEQLEQMNEEKERVEKSQKVEQQKKEYDAEMTRLEREAKERELQRQREEHKEIQRKHAKERIEQLKKTELGAKVLQNYDEEEFADLDIDEIMAKQVEQLEKEKKELNEKLKSQDRKIDYFVRAKRQEEIPMLQKQYEEQRVKMKELWDIQEKERIVSLEEERELAVKTKERLLRMVDDKNKFVSQLQEHRRSVHSTNLNEFEKMLAAEKNKRLVERKERRKVERKQQWQKEKEEELQRIADEKLLKEREEREQLEKENEAKEEADYKERMEMMDAMEAKQREREREIAAQEAIKAAQNISTANDDGSSPEKRAWRPAFRSSEGRPEGEAGGASSWRMKARDGDDGPRPERRLGDDRGPDDGERKPRDEHAEREPGRWSTREDFRDRGPPREDFRERGPPRDDFRERGPPRDDFRERGPPRDDFRERGPPRDDFRERGPPRDDFRERGPPRDDFRERGPPREDFGERGPPRGGDRPEGAWRRGGEPESDKGAWGRRTDDRDGQDRGAWGRRDGGNEREWRRGDDRDRPEKRFPERSSGGFERSSGGFDRDRRNDDRGFDGDRRPVDRGFDRDRRPDDRGFDRDRRPDDRERGGDTWRRGGEPDEGRAPPPSRPMFKERSANDEEEKPRGPESDGWTTVHY